jgi:hypothetical protein
LETDRDADAKQHAVDDFSPFGKTAVRAAAVEPRWALSCAINFSGTENMVAQNFPF